jgi:D-alanyl-D-alanine carboxypeptidase
VAAPLPPSLAALHRELGIPENYGATHGLAWHDDADEASLVLIGTNPDGRPVRLVPAAAAAWERLRAAAARDGIILLPISGHRSIARQTEIIREKLRAGRPLPHILRFVAAPGFSEHHTGRALDIGCPGHAALEEDFETTPAFLWLERHAGARGFTLSYPRGAEAGIGYEPWHWLYSD